MPSPNTTIPAILWGTSFANTWLWAAPADNPLPDTIIQGASAESSAGTVDQWLTRIDQVLRVTSRMIPPVTTSGSATCWATTGTGVRAALAWMKQRGNLFRYCPDSTALGTYHTSVLLEDPKVQREQGGAYYMVELYFRDQTGAEFAEY